MCLVLVRPCLPDLRGFLVGEEPLFGDHRGEEHLRTQHLVHLSFAVEPPELVEVFEVDGRFPLLFGQRLCRPEDEGLDFRAERLLLHD